MKVTRRQFLRLMTGGVLGAAALGGLGTAQGYRFGVTRHTRPIPGLRQPLRVAFLTDLHYHRFIGPRSVRAWVQATNALKPDLILLGGDFMDYDLAGPPTELLNEVRLLRAPLGAYGVWGNHDYGSFGQRASRYQMPERADWRARREEMRAAFEQAGVIILRNGGRVIRPDCFLGGVDDLWHGQPDVAAALAGAGGRATLLLSHNPDLLPDLPQAAGLVLCGHTHGGQVRLPLVGALSVPSRYGQRYAMGWVQGAHATPAYVSRGLGMTGLPVRNLCEPEITLLTLNPA